MKILDNGCDQSIARLVLDLIDETGYTPEEAISGLCLAIWLLGDLTISQSQALDEAVAVLSDGPVEEEIV